MEKTSIKTHTTTEDKTGFTSAELEEKLLKIAENCKTHNQGPCIQGPF